MSQEAESKDDFKSDETLSSKPAKDKQKLTINTAIITSARPLSIAQQHHRRYSSATSPPPLLFNSRHRYSSISLNSASSDSLQSRFQSTNSFSKLSLADLAEEDLRTGVKDKRAKIMNEIVETEIKYVEILVL